MLLKLMFILFVSWFSFAGEAQVEPHGFPVESARAYASLKFSEFEEPKVLGKYYYVFEARVKSTQLSREAYFKKDPEKPDPMTGADVRQSIQVSFEVKSMAQVSDGPWKGAEIVLIFENGTSLLEEDVWSDPSYSAIHTGVLFPKALAAKLKPDYVRTRGKGDSIIALVGQNRSDLSSFDRDYMLESLLNDLKINSIYQDSLPDEFRRHPYLMNPPQKFMIGESTFVIAHDADLSYRKMTPTPIKHPFYGKSEHSDYSNIVSFRTPIGLSLYYHFEPPSELFKEIEGIEKTGMNFSCTGQPGKRDSDPFLKALDFVDAPDDAFTALPDSKKYKLLTAKIDSVDFEEEYSNYSENADSYFAYKENMSRSENRFGDTPLPIFLEKKLSKEEYLAHTPAIYWKTPLGKYLKCANTSIGAPYMAEPVLYLYPPAKTAVDIQLSDRVEIESSRPSAQDNFWSVSVEPGGRIEVAGDPQKYKYLFWEGRSTYFPEPDSWFYVKKEKLEEFFLKTLPKLGLNESETKDFVAFWKPRMNKSPYYAVYFHTDYMNVAAPYQIRPAPESLIRVMMDYRPVERPEFGPEPKLDRTPEREGFVAVEWGGLLR